MLTRRLGLLASLLTIGALPVMAERHPGGGNSGPGGHKQKDDAPAGTPADTPLGPVDTTARWAFIMDYDTGATLMEKQADERMPPSSMTKLMTMYLVYERLKQGRLKLDDELPVSEKAWRMQGSKMFVQIGSSVKVEDLIRGVIVQSGNDAGNRAGRGDRRVGGRVRRTDEQEGAGARPDPFGISRTAPAGRTRTST